MSKSEDRERRWRALERVGLAVYGDKWRNRLRQDLGLSSAYMTVALDRGISDDVLRKLNELNTAYRKDAIRTIRELIMSDIEISRILDEEFSGGIGHDQHAIEEEAERQRQGLQKLLPLINKAVAAAPSLPELKELAEAAEQYRIGRKRGEE